MTRPTTFTGATPQARQTANLNSHASWHANRAAANASQELDWQPIVTHWLEFLGEREAQRKRDLRRSRR